LEPGVLFLQLLLVPERFFPLPCPLTGHEALFGLDGGIRPRGPLGTVVCPLKARLPRGIEWRACSTEGLLRCHTPFQRRRLQHLQDLCGDKVVQECSGPAAAAGGPLIESCPHTGVAQMIGLPAVGRHPPPPTPPTDEQAR
jgi:hypothetical protein